MPKAWTLQERTRLKGRLAENRAYQLLKKQGFRIKWPNEGEVGKPSNKPYDIVAEKDGKDYFIDVKSGNFAKNFFESLKNPTADIVGFAFIQSGELYLVTYEKHKEEKLSEEKA